MTQKDLDKALKYHNTKAMSLKGMEKTTGELFSVTGQLIGLGFNKIKDVKAKKKLEKYLEEGFIFTDINNEFKQFKTIKNSKKFKIQEQCLIDIIEEANKFDCKVIAIEEFNSYQKGDNVEFMIERATIGKEFSENEKLSIMQNDINKELSILEEKSLQEITKVKELLNSGLINEEDHNNRMEEIKANHLKEKELLNRKASQIQDIYKEKERIEEEKIKRKQEQAKKIEVDKMKIEDLINFITNTSFENKKDAYDTLIPIGFYTGTNKFYCTSSDELYEGFSLEENDGLYKLEKNGLFNINNFSKKKIIEIANAIQFHTETIHKTETGGLSVSVTKDVVVFDKDEKKDIFKLNDISKIKVSEETQGLFMKKTKYRIIVEKNDGTTFHDILIEEKNKAYEIIANVNKLLNSEK